MKNKPRKLILAGVISAIVSASALAQTVTELEEIVVTGTKRASTIKDVPFSINAQTLRDIQRSGATNLEEASRNVAGLAIQNLGPGQSQVAIRGVSAGQIVRDQPGVKEQVGVYLDESVISLSLFTPDLDLYDLNRVETLRGPQGTLFGSGSIGGTIRYITNQPDLKDTYGAFELDLNSISDGDTGGHAKGYYNAALTDTSALRVVAYHTEYGGYIDAFGPGGGDDVNSGTRSGGRIALTFQPSDAITITPRLIFQAIETDGFNRAERFNFLAAGSDINNGLLPDNNQQFLLQSEAFEDDTVIADLTFAVDLGAVELTSVTSYTEREILVSRDASALTHSVSEDFGMDPAANALPSRLNDTTDVEQVTQELRLSSTGDDNAIDWIAGAFYSDTQREYAQRLPTPGYDVFLDQVIPTITGVPGLTADDVANGFPSNSPFNSDLPYDLEQYGVFGEVNFNLSDAIQLTMGGRFYDFEEERTITTGGIFASGDTGVVDATSSDGFNPRILLSMDTSDNITVNAQISQGFRLGGVNDPLNTTLCTPSDLEIFGNFQDYDDETLTNYELGVKGFFDTLQFSAALYRADIEDLQVTLDAGSCSSRISFNVEDAQTTGIEFELKTVPTNNLEFSLAGSFLEAEFGSTVRDGNGNILGGVEKGNRLPSVPEYSGAATATYSVPAELFGSSGEYYFSASAQFVGDRITQPSDQLEGAGVFTPGLVFGSLNGTEVVQQDLELPSYEVVNLRAGYETEDWTAVIYINNAFDEEALLSFDRERGGRARIGFRTNQPRTLGITYRRNF